jgi:hypothetical protein
VVMAFTFFILTFCRFRSFPGGDQPLGAGEVSGVMAVSLLSIARVQAASGSRASVLNKSLLSDITSDL